MANRVAESWDVHLKIAANGTVAVACRRGETSLTRGGVERCGNADYALRLVERLLGRFGRDDELFVAAHHHDGTFSAWSTRSRFAGLYWCAAELSKALEVKSRPDEQLALSAGG